MLVQYIENRLNKRKSQGNYRALGISPALIDFASNDYLGLSRSSKLTSKIHRAISQQQNRLGSTGSRLLTGNSFIAEKLEEQIARFHGYEAALLYNCGYMANLGLMSSILDPQDNVFFDAHIHASTHDGIRLSKARAFPFRHNDLYHLEKRLKASLPHRNRYICVESIYSMDGSQAPLQEICLLAKKYHADVIVDESHATGVFGHTGEGIIENQKKFPEVAAKIVTFSKGLGVHGGAILGSQILKEFLLNFSNAQIYTTAMPFYSLASIKCSYEMLPKLEKERLHIKKLIEICDKHLPNASKTHIQPFYINENEAAKKLSKALASNGFDVRALLSPTVQRGGEILRLSLHAFNREKEMMSLIKILKNLEVIYA